MYRLLLVLLILDSLVLVAAILMQAAKGGGLAATFGGVSTAADAFIGSRQAGDLLTKTTWGAGGMFLFLAFLMQLMSTRSEAPGSILDQLPNRAPPSATQPPPATTTPVVPLAPTGKEPAPAQKKNP